MPEGLRDGPVYLDCNATTPVGRGDDAVPGYPSRESVQQPSNAAPHPAPRWRVHAQIVARGASTRQVAKGLGITAKTAGTHIERIYAKIGASSRSTATFFALQHGLLDTLNPVEL
jgi:DNA-binding NarL/FixJ family response regulator